MRPLLDPEEDEDDEARTEPGLEEEDEEEEDDASDNADDDESPSLVTLEADTNIKTTTATTINTRNAFLTPHAPHANSRTRRQDLVDFLSTDVDADGGGLEVDVSARREVDMGVASPDVSVSV